MDVLLGIGIVALIWYVGVKSSFWMQERELHPKAPHHTRLWYWFCHQWKRLEDYAHAHQRPFHRAHGVVHASYFTMVFTHGPYNVGAGLMLALIIIGWLLHLEDR